MRSDMVKLISSHLVAVVGAIGGPILIVWLFLSGSSVPGIEGLLALLGTYVGASYTFLFGSEVATATRRTLTR
jgi:hypothetical protein